MKFTDLSCDIEFKVMCGCIFRKLKRDESYTKKFMPKGSIAKVVKLCGGSKPCWCRMRDAGPGSTFWMSGEEETEVESVR